MKDLSSLVARIFLSGIFLESGFGKIAAFASVRQQMAAQGMPYTAILLCCAIVIEIVGGLSLLLGYQTKLGVSALLIFLAIATLIFHTHFGSYTEDSLLEKPCDNGWPPYGSQLRARLSERRSIIHCSSCSQRLL